MLASCEQWLGHEEQPEETIAGKQANYISNCNQHVGIPWLVSATVR